MLIHTHPARLARPCAAIVWWLNLPPREIIMQNWNDGWIWSLSQIWLKENYWRTIISVIQNWHVRWCRMQLVWKFFPREFTLIHRLVEGFNVTFYVLIIYPKSVGILCGNTRTETISDIFFWRRTLPRSTYLHLKANWTYAQTT